MQPFDAMFGRVPMKVSPPDDFWRVCPAPRLASPSTTCGEHGSCPGRLATGHPDATLLKDLNPAHLIALDTRQRFCG